MIIIYALSISASISSCLCSFSYILIAAIHVFHAMGQINIFFFFPVQKLNKSLNYPVSYIHASFFWNCCQPQAKFFLNSNANKNYLFFSISWLITSVIISKISTFSLICSTSYLICNTELHFLIYSFLKIHQWSIDAVKVTVEAKSVFLISSNILCKIWGVNPASWSVSDFVLHTQCNYNYNKYIYT